jgi:hypothetical protein
MCNISTRAHPSFHSYMCINLKYNHFGNKSFPKVNFVEKHKAYKFLVKETTKKVKSLRARQNEIKSFHAKGEKSSLLWKNTQLL